MTTAAPFRTLLVTGASGHLGRRVVDLLIESHAGRVIAASRTPEKLNDLTLHGAELKPLNFDNPVSLDAAFAGVRRLLLVSTDEITEPGRRLSQHRNAIEAAVRCGVQHVVYTSITQASPDSVVAVTKDHQETERLLAGTKLGWTILRNNLYAENLLPVLTHALTTGQWRTAAGEGAAAYVTREDCAQAAAAALSGAFDGQRTLDITGPMAVTHGMIAHWVAETTGKPLVHVPVDVATVEADWVQAGVPARLAAVLATFDAGIAKGEFGRASRVVSELTGRPPMNLPAFIRAHRAHLLQL
ncbi:MAG TPA: SDR family oxidoreductase [Rariglobus sp.]|jgi:NAD(P)H dehydrogenase (quinone)|nr:SDR family oxidoreductase [Rariglobus sp.]